MTGWATDISAGSGDASSLGFTIANSDPELFADQPAIDASSGTLTYTTAANAFGTATIDVVLAVDGGTVGGADASVEQEFTITIEPPPTVAGFTAQAGENSVAALSAADFSASFSDADPNDSLQTVEITTLPSEGQLTLSGTAVTAGQEIAAADLDNLAYQPAAGYTGSDVFFWNASDGLAYAAATATVSIAVEPPPVAGGIAKTAIENTELDFTAADFTSAYSDADPNDALQTVAITVLPSQGQLSLDGTPVTAGEEISVGDLSGLCYQPNPSFIGSDAFSWTASDGLTYSANAGTVSISVQAGGPTVDLGPADASGNPTLDFTATFVQGDASAPIAAGDATIADPAGGTLQGMTATIVGWSADSGETLSADTTGTAITATFQDGQLTLAGSDTLADYQAVLQTIAYQNNSTDLDGAVRQIQVVACDGTSITRWPRRTSRC